MNTQILEEVATLRKQNEVLYEELQATKNELEELRQRTEKPTIEATAKMVTENIQLRQKVKQLEKLLQPDDEEWEINDGTLIPRWARTINIYIGDKQ